MLTAQHPGAIPGKLAPGNAWCRTQGWSGLCMMSSFRREQNAKSQVNRHVRAKVAIWCR